MLNSSGFSDGATYVQYLVRSEMYVRIIYPDNDSRFSVADALGDSPESAISCDRLRRGFARAHVLTEMGKPLAVIVQSSFISTDPIAFGARAGDIWTVLRTVEGWQCVNAPQAVASDLQGILMAETGREWAPMPEIHYQMDQPNDDAPNTQVRRLTKADVALLEVATDAFGLVGWRFGSAEALLRDGFAAGAVVEGKLVSVAFTTAITPRFGEVGISTLAPYRGRSYSTAAAALVCADVHAAGLTPTWSTGEDNAPSRRVAEKLGFNEVSRRVYLNPVGQ